MRQLLCHCAVFGDDRETDSLAERRACQRPTVTEKVEPCRQNRIRNEEPRKTRTQITASTSLFPGEVDQRHETDHEPQEQKTLRNGKGHERADSSRDPAKAGKYESCVQRLDDRNRNEARRDRRELRDGECGEDKCRPGFALAARSLPGQLIVSTAALRPETRARAGRTARASGIGRRSIARRNSCRRLRDRRRDRFSPRPL